MLNGKGPIEFARDRPSRRSTGWAWSGGRGGAGRLIGTSPRGPGRWEGQREERGRDVRVGLRKPAGGVGRT